MSQLAQQLIEQEKAERTGYLDLGNCGLTQLPDLSELSWLHTLIASSRWYEFDPTKNKWQRFESKNTGPKNIIDPPEEPLPLSLKKIVLRDCHISDARFLQKLSKLTSLDLRSNQISDASFLEKLSKLTSLDLSGNRISDASFLEKLSKLTSLDLRFNQISDASFLEKLSKLTSLDLRSNQISDASFLEKLSKLTSLDLRSNQISDASFLEKLSNLTSLDLSDNQISDASFLEKLSKLTSLDLSGNRISDASFLQNLNSLNYLDLSNNQISDARFLEKLSKLTSLDLGDNQISNTRFLEKLSKLTSLDLSFNPISDTLFLEKLSKLTSLDLSGNQISDWSSLQKLSKLTSLDLSYNQFSDASFLQNLNSLNYLDLSNNQISDARFLEKLSKLTSLDLRSNQISDASFLQKLSKLTSLDLSGNQISDASFLQKLSKLTSLDLSGNQISDWSFLEKLSKLTSLDLSGNRISDASFLEKLSKLTSLDLSYNPISDWSFLQKLSKLTSLDLSGNPISDARFLQKLSKLRRIVLYDNHVADLSPLLFFIKEKGLQVVSKPWYKTKDGEINIGGNPLSTPPLEIVQQGNAAIIRYFEEKARLEKAPDAQPALIKVREAKVLLVGQGKSGKTTLRRKLEDPDAAMPEPGDSTRGIEITRLDERMPHTGDALRLNLWDFGGQDIQHYAHQFFLTGSSLYVLVTNERIQDGVHLPYWLNIIELLGKKSPVVIVQNMDGGHCQPLKDEAAIRARFANVHNRTFQSDFSKAKIEPAFSALRKKIVELAAELPHIEREYLRSFNDLRQKLEAEAVHPTHYLRWDDYLALMPELGEDLMRDYANALTFLGVCQYFPHDALLSQYVFLRPKWLIDALFELLLHSHFEKTRGTFAESDTFHIWQGEAYRGMHALLVRMMKEFELCYLVADNEEKYIVPQRLPGENKSYGWNSTGDVPVQYRYKFMPKGILTRLICRLHPRIEKDSVLGQRVWNDAVIFTLPDGKGRVFAREVYSENIIELRAEVIKHAEMLNEVIRKMDDINADTKYDNLQVEKMVPCPCAECAIAESPGFHEFDALQKRIEKGKPTSECKRSGEDVPIDEIFGKSGVTKPKRHRDELANPFETRPSVPKPLKAFFSYSKQDYENYLAPLLDYLNPLVKSRLFAPWHNRQILPGEDWDDRIQAEIEQADIIFLLVSTHSLNTDYIWNVEIEAAMRRHEAGTAKVVPIILSKCLWEETDQEGNYIFPPAKLNALPTKGKPVSEWSSREDAWDEVSKGVKELCKQISAQL